MEKLVKYQDILDAMDKFAQNSGSTVSKLFVQLKSELDTIPAQEPEANNVVLAVWKNTPGGMCVGGEGSVKDALVAFSVIVPALFSMLRQISLPTKAAIDLIETVYAVGLEQCPGSTEAADGENHEAAPC